MALLHAQMEECEALPLTLLTVYFREDSILSELYESSQHAEEISQSLGST